MADQRREHFETADVELEEDLGHGRTAKRPVSLTAPYAFVPLEKPLPSPFGDKLPSHETPYPNGICGSFEVEWRFDQPVLVGGSKKVKNDPSVFAMAPDGTPGGRPAIPGGTIRGLLRNVIEIATGSTMSLVDQDAFFSVRDTSDATWQNMNPTKQDRAQSFGWLRGIDGKTPAKNSCEGWELEIIERAELIPTSEYLEKTTPTDMDSISKDLDEFERKAVDAKYAEIAQRGGCFIDRMAGWLVVGGPDPNAGRDNAKKWSMIFYTPQERRAPMLFPVPAVVMKRFIETHKTTTGTGESGGARSAWDFWVGNLKDGDLPGKAHKRPMRGIPVFIGHAADTSPEVVLDTHKDDSSANVPTRELFLSLGRLMKIPHAYGLREVLERQGHRADGPLDFARALFGQVPPEKPKPGTKGEPGKRALKGRVFCGEAVLEGEKPDDPIEEGVTMSPRASFWPYYLAPGPDAEDGVQFDYSNEKAVAAGWKRYPVRPEPVKFATDPREDASEGMKAKMQFLKADKDHPLRFKGPIRVHNILPVELGALLWAITWGESGGTREHHHMIGRGKAQGFGRCCGTLVAEGMKLEVNDGTPLEPVDDYIGEFKAWVRNTYAETFGKTHEKFEDLPFIALLLALADPRVADRLKDRLVYPTANVPPPSDESKSLRGYKLVREAARSRNVETAAASLASVGRGDRQKTDKPKFTIKVDAPHRVAKPGAPMLPPYPLKPRGS